VDELVETQIDAKARPRGRADLRRRFNQERHTDSIYDKQSRATDRAMFTDDAPYIKQ
jgi:hypothetical protein